MFIKEVLPGSVGEELGLQAGDRLWALGGHPVCDILDYQYYNAQEKLTLTAVKAGKAAQFEIEKYTDETLGLVFEEEGLRPRPCPNKCIFCFFDQVPAGMRFAAPVKKDDWRQSFLKGSFVSLNNVDEEELERIIRQKRSPLYVSVHATNPEMRARLMNNPAAGNIMNKLRRLAEGGIDFYAEVVLLPDYNDGYCLRQTFEDLLVLHPRCRGLAIVPVTLTIHRRGLARLRRISEQQAEYLLDDIERWQDKCRAVKGTRFLFAADELYLRAGRALPAPESYEGFPFLRRGVGNLAKFKAEFEEGLKKMPPWVLDRQVSLVVGTTPYPHIKALCDRLSQQYPNLTVYCYPVRNFYFGESVTATELLTGKDIGVQVEGKKLGSELFIPASMLTGGQFLDNVSLPSLGAWLNVPVTAVAEDGAAFAFALAGVRPEEALPPKEDPKPLPPANNPPK